jgi:phosphoglycolate phosphatase-like HAD superfamily hydrolase
MPDAVLLDIDGTLVRSNDAHARAWIETFAEAGFTVPFERVRPLIGMGSDKLVPALVPVRDAGAIERLAERRSAIFRERHLPHLEPTRGSAALVARLRAERIRAVVATSAKEEEVRELLAIAGAPELAETATSGDDVERSKPDPDVVHAALGRTGVSPERVLMIGDTPWDIEAAARAGVGTIALRSGGWKDADLPGARAIYADPADLLAHWDESPLGRR